MDNDFIYSEEMDCLDEMLSNYDDDEVGEVNDGYDF